MLSGMRCTGAIQADNKVRILALPGVSEVMKIGDIIYRKDMPQFQFRIVASSSTWKNTWEVQPVFPYRGFGSWKGVKLIDKDDERWAVKYD